MIKSYGRDCATLLGLTGTSADTGHTGPDLLDLLPDPEPEDLLRRLGPTRRPTLTARTIPNGWPPPANPALGCYNGTVNSYQIDQRLAEFGEIVAALLTDAQREEILRLHNDIGMACEAHSEGLPCCIDVLVDPQLSFLNGNPGVPRRVTARPSRPATT